MRTREEILEQLEARYKDLETIANSPEKLYPCRTCKFCKDRMSGVFQKCTNPLIVGFDRDFVYSWDVKDGTHLRARLCGPEKALWEPRKSLLSRIIGAFTDDRLRQR